VSEVTPPPYNPPTPKARVGRTAVQVLGAVLLSIPAAAAALTSAGVNVSPKVLAYALGIPAALVIVISAAVNAYDASTGKG
jgi:hypothetical protein